MEQQNNNSENNKEHSAESLPEVQYELSKVASNPKQSILILVLTSIGSFSSFTNKNSFSLGC